MYRYWSNFSVLDVRRGSLAAVLFPLSAFLSSLNARKVRRKEESQEGRERKKKERERDFAAHCHTDPHLFQFILAGVSHLLLRSS